MSRDHGIAQRIARAASVYLSHSCGADIERRRQPGWLCGPFRRIFKFGAFLLIMLKTREYFNDPRVPGRVSLRKLPREHDAADFEGPAPVRLARTASEFDDRPIAVQLDHSAAVDQPK